MATFRLVAFEDLDVSQPQFAFEVSGGSTFLKFGLLNSDDTRLFSSILTGASCSVGSVFCVCCVHV